MKNDNWTTERIKEGFEKFLTEHGRLPTAPEVDAAIYLPSSRQIQRRFGGLEKLRALLGYTDTHFGKGIFRGNISLKTGERGRKAEIALEGLLREKFGEVFVHTEKIFDDSKNRVDFYIYSPDGNFGVDVFDTETMKDLQKNINIKIEKYKNFLLPLYFVVANNNFLQHKLDNYALNKSIKPLSPNMKIATMETFIRELDDKSSYPNPLP